MAGHAVVHSGSVVGDDGNTQHFHAGVGGADNFGHGGHTDGVAAEKLKHFDFGRGFKTGAERPQIDAFVERNIPFGSQFFDFMAPFGRIGVGHAGKTRSIAVIVGADQRICAAEIDMILYQHQRTRSKFGIERAGGIGDD